MAITLKTAKKTTRYSNGTYKNIKPEFFGNKHRKVFTIEPSEEILKSHIQGSRTYRDIKLFLERNNYSIVDYVDGVAVDNAKPSQPRKIGRVLNFLGATDLLEAFKTDSVRNFKNLRVVVSRHPYDLAGMSTGRGWRSCMAEDGENYRFVRADILGGTLIAYLVSDKDLNIKNPNARLLIKRYEDENGYGYYNPASRVYGIDNIYFRSTVENICKEINKDVPEGLFKFNDSFYYNDGEIQEIDTRSEETKQKEKRRKIMAMINKQKMDYAPFKVYFDMLSNKVKTSTAYINFTNFVTNACFLDNTISEKTRDEFFRLRDVAFYNGIPSFYVEDMAEKIKNYENISAEDVDYLTYEFIRGLCGSHSPTPLAFISIAKALSENCNPFHAIKQLDSIPQDDLNNTRYPSIHGSADSYDYNLVAEIMAEQIIKVSNMGITDIYERKLFSYNFSYIVLNLTGRCKKLEYAVMCLLKSDRIRNDFFASYGRNSHVMTALMNDYKTATGADKALLTCIDNMYYSRFSGYASMDKAYADKNTGRFTCTESEAKENGYI